MKHARLSGWLLIITGLLHTASGLVSGYPYLISIVQAGVVNAVAPSLERAYLVWFLVAGVGLILSGLLALGYDRPLPASVGWGLLGLSVVGVLLMPTSGFWLLIPQAVYILLVARHATLRRAAS